MKIKRILLFFVLLSTPYIFWGQDDLDQNENNFYKKYDKSFITTDLRRKHAVSFGPLFGSYDESFINLDYNNNDFIPQIGLHLGYNFLVLERRVLKSSSKKKRKYRQEVKLSGGIHINYLKEDDFIVAFNFFRPFISTKGRFFSWNFISAYSLGFHKVPKNSSIPKNNSAVFSLEFFRLRIGKAPLYIHSNINYDLGREFFGMDRLNMGWNIGIRFDFFKMK